MYFIDYYTDSQCTIVSNQQGVTGQLNQYPYPLTSQNDLKFKSFTLNQCINADWYR